MRHYHWKSNATPPKTIRVSLYHSAEATNVACDLPFRYVKDGKWVGDKHLPGADHYCIAAYDVEYAASNE